MEQSYLSSIANQVIKDGFNSSIIGHFLLDPISLMSFFSPSSVQQRQPPFTDEEFGNEQDFSLAVIQSRHTQKILIHSNSKWTGCVLPKIPFCPSYSMRSACAMSTTVAQKSLRMLSKASIWADKHRICLHKSAAHPHGSQSTEGNRRIFTDFNR